MSPIAITFRDTPLPWSDGAADDRFGELNPLFLS